MPLGRVTQSAVNAALVGDTRSVAAVAVVYDQPEAEIDVWIRGIRAMKGGPYPVWLAVTKPGRALRCVGDGVAVVPLERNVGWTGGANAAALEAMRSGCQTLVFLNTDVHFASDELIARLVGALHSRPDVAFVSPLITTFPDTTRAWYRGARYSARTWITRHPGIGARFNATDQLLETSMPSGCCMAVRGEVFVELGGFDEELFGYFDEADLAYRARRSGWRAALLDAPLLAHRHRKRELTAVSAFYFGRNPLLLSRKHAGLLGWVLAACAAFGASPYYLARCEGRDARWAYVRGVSAGIAHVCGWPHTGEGHGAGRPRWFAPSSESRAR